MDLLVFKGDEWLEFLYLFEFSFQLGTGGLVFELELLDEVLEGFEFSGKLVDLVLFLVQFGL